MRERRQAEVRPRPRLIRVREQSAFVDSPRQQARQRSVRNRDQGSVSTVHGLTAATDMDAPRTGQDPELAVATTSPLSGIGHESQPTTNCPTHPIAVAISPLIRFPVHIRIISNHVRI